MRASILFGFVAATAIGVAACSGQATGSEPVAPPAEPPVCAARDAAVCSNVKGTSFTNATTDEPSHDAALVWAQVSVGPTAPDRGGSRVKVALYDDATLRRSVVQRNLFYTLTPPRGLVVAKVTAPSMTKLRADIAAVADAELRGYFGPNETIAHDSGVVADVLDIRSGTACFYSVGNAHSSCTPPALTTLRAELTSLAAASENTWRAAQAGTVSLGAEIKVVGDWPLADDRAFEGGGTLTRDEWSKVGSTGIFRLQSGEYVEVNFADASLGANGGVYVYSSRMSAVTLGDDVAPLRAELVANQGRYVATAGAWLGVELGPDRFPSFKNRELAVIPSSGGAPASLHYLYAIEHLDLRSDGELALP